MATWDDNFWYGGNNKELGLKTCPFNAAHKVKATSYHKHVLKCEQSFPNQRLSSHSRTSPSNMTIKTNLSDIDRITTSLSQLSASEFSQFADSSERIDCRSPDSAIDIRNNSSADNTENEDQLQRDDRFASQSCGQHMRAVTAGTALPILPQNLSNQVNEDSGAGDPDDWNSSFAPSFDIYEGFEKLEELNDEQIQLMADNFIDIVFISRLSRLKRKLLYKKLIDLRNANHERRQKAIKELMANEDIHPAIKEIPQEIRKPKVDVRCIFNFKKENNGIDSLGNTLIPAEEAETKEVKNPKEEASSPEPSNVDETTPIPKLEIIDPKDNSVNSFASPDEENGSSEVKVSCSNCWAPLEIVKDNYKNVMIFCERCTRKMGGYFECQDCKLYGYFSKTAIDDHLKKHFHN